MTYQSSFIFSFICFPNSNSMGGVLRSTALGASHLSQNQFMNKTNNTINEMEGRRLMLSNGSQMQMYSSNNTNNANTNGNNYQQRTLNSSSGSSIPQTDTLKENHEK